MEELHHVMGLPRHDGRRAVHWVIVEMEGRRDGREGSTVWDQRFGVWWVVGGCDISSDGRKDGRDQWLGINDLKCVDGGGVRGCDISGDSDQGWAALGPTSIAMSAGEFIYQPPF